MLAAMLIAGLNYNSNLGLAFAFLMASVALVTMHHCNRNLLGLQVDVTAEVDAFAGGEASFDFVLRNDSSVDRRDVEIRCLGAAGMRSVLGRIERDGSGRRSGGAARSDPDCPVRAAHALSLRLVPRLDLCAGLADRLRRSRAARQPRRCRPSGGSGHAARSEARGDEDFAGLRAYEPGMPLKHMAWKVLARGGEAAVRSYSSLAAQPEWLEWSSLEGQDTEARLSQLCLWVLESEAAQRVYRPEDSRQGDCPGAGRGASICLPAGACPLRDGGAAVNPKTRDVRAAPWDLRLPRAGARGRISRPCRSGCW